MNADDLLGSGSSICLPSAKSPRVILAIDNAAIASNSFELYNPFSKQARIFKLVVRALCCYANPLSKWLLADNRANKSKFQEHLEKQLKKPLWLSVYKATADDKVVLQLQSANAEILGYLKFPLNDRGLKHLENEKKAIDTLSTAGVIPAYESSNDFDNTPYLILKPLQGRIGQVDDDSVSNILNLFRRKESFQLLDHPRIEQLGNQLTKYKMQDKLDQLNGVCQQSTLPYSLVYEHGDFAPWNIVETEQGYVPFDFEFFIEDGLEHLDLIKYNYQIATLLEKKSGRELILSIKNNLQLNEFEIIFTIFLIKEIMRCHEEGESFQDEESLLEQLQQVGEG